MPIFPILYKLRYTTATAESAGVAWHLHTGTLALEVMLRSRAEVIHILLLKSISFFSTYP